jgi:predicted nicotinamide N-methyase
MVRRLLRRFPAAEMEIEVGDRVFRMLRPTDIDGLIRRAKEEDELPFWAYLWPSAIGLARRLLLESSPTPLFGTPTPRLLELGAGLGLAGIAGATLGCEVFQTDIVSSSLRFARVNGLRNGHDLPGFVADWRRFGVRAEFDGIIASDILYEPTLHPALKRVFGEHLRPGGKILIADPCRVYALQFMAILEDAGWSVRVTDAPFLPEDDTHVLLYEAEPPAG